MPPERTLVSDSDLAFRPSLIKRRFIELCTAGLGVEKAYDETLKLGQRDLTFYFLEQFAKKKLVNFGYRFETNDVSGQTRMVSAHYERFGDVYELFAHAVEERKSAGISSEREEAELAGFFKIRKVLFEVCDWTSVVLVSPPPPTSDHSFTYFGLYDPDRKSLDMFAWRNNLALLSQRDLVNSYAEEMVINPSPHPNDFLQNPVFKKGQAALEAHRRFLTMAGAPPADLYQYREIIDKAAEMLVGMIRNGAGDWQLNLAQAEIELEFAKLVEGIDNKPEFAFEPANAKDHDEAVKFLAAKQQLLGKQIDLVSYTSGHCGVSMFAIFGNRKGLPLNILTISVTSDLVSVWGKTAESYFECPRCHGTIESGQGITNCPHCGYTKEQAAKDLGVSC